MFIGFVPVITISLCFRISQLNASKPDKDQIDPEYQYYGDLDNYIDESKRLTIPINLSPKIRSEYNEIPLDIKNQTDLQKLGLQARAKRQINFTEDTLLQVGSKHNKNYDNDAVILESSSIDDDNYKKPISRRKIQNNKEANSLTSREAKAIKKEKERIKKLYENKIKEIMQFLGPNYISTNYMYEEMKRIKKQGDSGDKLSALVDHLEKPELKILKENVLKCFWNEVEKNKVIKPKDVWKGRVPNNVVISPFKDPYIYG